MKRLSKIFFVAALLMVLSNIKAFATDEPKGLTEAQIDNVAPVFDSNIQTRYVVKGVDDGSQFVPQNVITGITATDDVDGNDVKIDMIDSSVDLSTDGQYYVAYSATDKSGNSSFMSVAVIVDKTAPTFDENIEKMYHINSKGMILDSKNNVVEGLPETLIATDSVGAYKGIGVYIINDEQGNIVFCGTIENSPAAAVLQPNDILIGINGEDVRGQTPSYVATKIKGEEGTDVNLRIIRNNQEMTVTIQRQVIKLYEDEEFVATPDVEITSIDTKTNGVIEITYTATDEAGNTSEFVVTVVVDLTAPVLYIDGKKTDEEEGLFVVTTGDTPPEDFELPTVKATDFDLIEQKEVELSADSIKIEKNFENEPYTVTYTVTDAAGNTTSYTIYLKAAVEKAIENTDETENEEKTNDVVEPEVKEEAIIEVEASEKNAEEVQQEEEKNAEAEVVVEEVAEEKSEAEVSEEVQNVESQENVESEIEE